MAQQPLANYLRSYRKRSGLSQLELARLLGHDREGQISRHERACNVPPLPAALAYQAVFQVPIAELFPGLYRSIEREIETRLVAFELSLQEKDAKDSDGNATAHKLEWCSERRQAKEDALRR
jgi:transcriptional regulator with XRE-family HTH domain